MLKTKREQETPHYSKTRVIEVVQSCLGSVSLPLTEFRAWFLCSSLLPMITIILLFTLGSIYSTNASGAEQMSETITSNQT